MQSELPLYSTYTQASTRILREILGWLAVFLSDGMHKDSPALYKHPDGHAGQAAWAPSVPTEPLERSLMKSQRQGVIVEVVEREPIYNQELLRRRLRAR